MLHGGNEEVEECEIVPNTIIGFGNITVLTACEESSCRNLGIPGLTAFRLTLSTHKYSEAVNKDCPVVSMLQSDFTYSEKYVIFLQTDGLIAKA